jgi:trigger factor
LRYHATVEVKPDVTVEGYTGLSVDRPLLPVTDEDVTAALGRLQQSLAQLRPVTDRSHIERGDVVSLDYEAHIDGRLTSRGENRDVELGANRFPPGFDDRLVGAPVGGKLDFDITYPTEHPAPELAGKDMHFHVEVRSISVKEVPPLDDDFAKDHGECSTLEELRQRLRRQLEADAAQRADEAVRRNVVVELAKRHDVPVPQAMVQRRTEALVEEVLHDWQRQRGRLKDDSQARAHLRKELEPRAHEQVKTVLLLDAVARQEAISVSDEEVEADVSALAQAAGSAAERVRALYRQPEARGQLRAQMLQSRAVDLLVSRAEIRDVSRLNVADPAETG